MPGAPPSATPLPPPLGPPMLFIDKAVATNIGITACVILLLVPVLIANIIRKQKQQRAAAVALVSPVAASQQGHVVESATTMFGVAPPVARPLGPMDRAAIDRLERERIASIKGLPVFAWAGGSNTGYECVLCLEGYVNNQVLRQLPCGHFYHKTCIDRWLIVSMAHMKRHCPLCKADPAGSKPKLSQHSAAPAVAALDLVALQSHAPDASRLALPEPMSPTTTRTTATASTPSSSEHSQTRAPATTPSSARRALARAAGTLSAARDLAHRAGGYPRYPRIAAHHTESETDRIRSLVVPLPNVDRHEAPAPERDDSQRDGQPPQMPQVNEAAQQTPAAVPAHTQARRVRPLLLLEEAYNHGDVGDEVDAISLPEDGRRHLQGGAAV